MSVKYKYSGLTKELHQRLVNERVALKLAHLRDYKQHFQKVRQCSEKQAIIILQALNSAVVERARISPQTVDRLEGIISDELYHDLKAYLAKNYTRGKTTRPFWIKRTQDCQRNYSSDSVRKWKGYARNTLTI